MFLDRQRPIRAASAAAVMALTVACRCSGNSDTAEDAGVEDSTTDPTCDAAGCTAACLRSGAVCGACQADGGCFCNSGCGEDARDDAPPPCSADDLPWDYPPIWTRSDGDEWSFDPPTWDVSAYRLQPVPGCDRVSLAQAEGGYASWAGQGWVDETHVALNDWVTVCHDGRPSRARGLLLLDMTSWAMSLIHIGATEMDHGFDYSDGGAARFALFSDGIVFTPNITLPCDTRCDPEVWGGTSVYLNYVVVYDRSEHTQRVVWRSQGESGGALSLHGGARYVVDQRGWDSSWLYAYDTEDRSWIPVATNEGYGLGGVWRVDFSGERAVFDYGAAAGIASAVVSRPEEIVEIGDTTAAQWSPTISGNVVCWNDGREGYYPGPGGGSGDATIRCTDLATGENWEASADLAADEQVLANNPGDSVPIVTSGRWVAFEVIPRGSHDAASSYWRLHDHQSGRSWRADPFGGVRVGVYALVGETVIVGGGDDVRLPLGYYRCDLRVLYPEAYATGTDGGVGAPPDVPPP